jgi:hypothetical protein
VHQVDRRNIALEKHLQAFVDSARQSSLSAPGAGWLGVIHMALDLGGH